MPSLKAIRNRIASVKNTQKITKAMKLVAAARLRRAQEAMSAARPYSARLREVIADLVARAGGESEEPAHPLLTRREGRRLRMIVVGSDRGLAGGYNSNLNRRVERYIAEEKPNFDSIELVTIGRKPREYFRRRGVALASEYPGVQSESAAERARELTQRSVEDFLEGRIDAIYVVYNEFKSAISQAISIDPVLPLAPAASSGEAALVDFKYEPSRQELLDTLLPMHLEVQFLQVMLEAIASEFGARMSAMDSATKNAKEMIGSLTLEFNRARQASITKELMEIVGGAEALKG